MVEVGVADDLAQLQSHAHAVRANADDNRTPHACMPKTPFVLACQWHAAYLHAGDARTGRARACSARLASSLLLRSCLASMALRLGSARFSMMPCTTSAYGRSFVRILMTCARRAAEPERSVRFGYFHETPIPLHPSGRNEPTVP